MDQNINLRSIKMEDTVRNSAGNIITIGRAVTEFAKTATTKAAELAPYETLSYKCLPIVGVALGTWIDIEIGLDFRG